MHSDPSEKPRARSLTQPEVEVVEGGDLLFDRVQNHISISDVKVPMKALRNRNHLHVLNPPDLQASRLAGGAELLAVEHHVFCWSRWSLWSRWETGGEVARRDPVDTLTLCSSASSRSARCVWGRVCFLLGRAHLKHSHRTRRFSAVTVIGRLAFCFFAADLFSVFLPDFNRIADLPALYSLLLYLQLQLCKFPHCWINRDPIIIIHDSVQFEGLQWRQRSSELKSCWCLPTGCVDFDSAASPPSKKVALVFVHELVLQM